MATPDPAGNHTGRRDAPAVIGRPLMSMPSRSNVLTPRGKRAPGDTEQQTELEFHALGWLPEAAELVLGELFDDLGWQQRGAAPSTSAVGNKRQREDRDE